MVLCTSLLSWAQTSIQGTVTNLQLGEPLQFVTVINITNQQATTTDRQGHFSINSTSPTDSLKLSSIGYEDRIILAQNNIHVNLKTAQLALNEVVVSVDREKESRTESPIAISSISQARIQEMKPTSIDQVLNQTPGVNMVDLGNEQHTMSIRRPIDYGASYLYMEDGIPIRTSGVFNHNALLEINMANTSKIEVIRGPVSNIYGSEAIGGALNFISKKPSLHPTAGGSLQANDIGYRRADFYASNTINNTLGLRFSGYYANQNNGIISHSNFDKLALSLSAHYFISSKTELVWSSSYIDYYADMTGSLDSADFYSKSYESAQTFTNRQVDAFRTKLALNTYWSAHSKLTLTGFFRRNSVKQNPSYRVKDDYKPWVPSGNPNLAHGEINNNSFKSFGLIAQQKNTFSWLNSTLITGGSLDYSPNTYEANYIEIHKNDQGIYDRFIQTDSLLADYNADLLNTAVYAQLKIEPVNGLHITGGIRYDHFKYAFDNHLGSNAFTSVLDGKNTFSQLTPKLGLTYDLKNNIGLYANYGQGFVPPQVSELYRGNDIPTLKPVYYENYELGGWMTFAKNKAKLDVSVYSMDGKDEIISVLLDDGSRVRQNAGKTAHKGIEYALNILVHTDLEFRFGGSNALHKFVDFNESGKDYSGNKMPQAPQWIANAQITYKPHRLKGLRIGLEWQHIDHYFMDQQNTKTYDGYNVFNLRLGYTWKSFEVWTNVLNVTNELYATVARATKWGQSYSLGKPRHIAFGIGYSFKGKNN